MISNGAFAALIFLIGLIGLITLAFVYLGLGAGLATLFGYFFIDGFIAIGGKK